MQRNFVLRTARAVAVVVCVSTAATAADLGGYQPRYQPRPQPPVEHRAPIWAGFYMGANIGYGTGDVWATGDTGRIHSTGVVGGMHAGYNWQVGSFVFGAEGDFGLSGMRGRAAIGDDVFDAHTRHMGSIRGRMGFAFDKALLYGTAGYGWNNVSLSLNDINGKSSVGHSNGGFVYGGGLEYKLTRNLSLRGEVLRYETSGQWDLNDGSKVTVHSPSMEFRTGITWHFN